MRAAPVALIFSLGLAAPAFGRPILLSANDGLQKFVDGAYQMRPHPGSGALSAFDLSTQPPQPLWSVPIDQTAIGPPTAIAVTPDGTLALIANPATLDPADPGKVLRTQELQIVNIDMPAPRVTRLPLKHHPWAVAMAPNGRLAATANGDGTMTLLRIADAKVNIIEDVRVGSESSLNTGVAFSADGHYLLATRRHDDLATLFWIEDETATPLRDITVGSNPYEIVVSPNGKWAAVSNIGRNSGDRDSVTFIDLSHEPIRTTNVLSVAPTPEGLAFSPDARWLAVNSINGSNLKPGDPFRTHHSLLQLFDLSSDSSHLVGEAELSPNAQGLAFTPDGSVLIAQDYATDSLVMFSAGPSGLAQIQMTISTEGGPSALAVVSPRSPP